MVGVSLFYLLSGFVMAWTDRTNDTPWLFYRRRFARIYPVYLVACLVAFALLLRSGEFSAADLSALSLMQSWVPSETFYYAGHAVFWSLSCETFFYLVFPWLRLFTRRLTAAGLSVLGVAALVVSFTIAWLGFALPLGSLTTWAVVIFPVSRLPEFVLGVVAGTLISRGWRPRMSVWSTLGLAVASVALAMFVPYSFSRYAVTLIPFLLLIIALAVSDLTGRKVFTQWGPMVKVGVWSYCFYLIHGMVLWLVVPFTSVRGVPELPMVLLSLAVSLFGAWLLHVAVERPAEKRLRPAGRQRLGTDETVAASSRF